MIGRRVLADEVNGRYFAAPEWGSYWCWEDRWYGCTPNGLLVDLSAYTVTENEDATITVDGPIQSYGGVPGQVGDYTYYGTLVDGEWSEL